MGTQLNLDAEYMRAQWVGEKQMDAETRQNANTSY